MYLDRTDGTDSNTLHRELAETVEPGSTVHTDDHGAYRSLTGYAHGHVKPGAGTFVGAGDVTTNSVESMWALLKRGLYGTWHKASRKHLVRYVNECTFRLNEGHVEHHTWDVIDSLVERAFAHRITYARLTA